MKRVLLLVPFVALGCSAICAMLVPRSGTWVGIPWVTSFVLSLLAVPVISRKSLVHGYLAVAFILVAFACPIAVGTRGDVESARLDIAKLFVSQSMQAPLTAYRIHVGRFPTTEEGLAALVRCPKGLEERWKGPYLRVDEGKLPSDPWGRPYQYRCPGVHNLQGYDLWSLGPDGVPSRDDIGNWKE